MIKYVSLGAFKVHEAGIDREAVNFQRQTIGIGRQLADGEEQVVADARVGPQVIRNVSPERTQIGEAACSDRVVLGALVFRVPVRDVAEFRVDVILEQAETAQVGYFLLSQEADAVHVDEDAAFDAPPDLVHRTVILETVFQEHMRGNDRERLVPVLYLHGVQRHLNHVTVCLVSRHLYPVAHADQVVTCQLRTGDEGQDGVLKDEQQNGRGRTDTGEDQQRITVQQRSDGSDSSQRIDDDNQALQITLYGPLA